MKIYRRISFFMASVLTGVLHAFAFVLGIGVVSMLFKVAGRHLLSRDGKSSTWGPVSGSGDAGRMY